MRLVEGLKVDSFKYTGPELNWLPHREGEYVGLLGVFKGTWLNGKREGRHSGKDRCEDVYEENYKNGKKYGYQKTDSSDEDVSE